MEKSGGLLVGTHCCSVKGKDDIVILHVATVMAPWEDAGTRHVRGGKYSGLALYSTLQDFAKHRWLKTNKTPSHCFKSLLFSLQLKANCTGCKYEGV